MVDKTKNERNIGLISGAIFFVWILVICGFSLFQMKQMKQITNAQMQNYSQIVGSTSNGNDITYAVSEVLKGETDKQAIKDGKKILGTYGYVEPYKFDYERLMKSLKYNIVFQNVFLLLALIGSLLLVQYIMRENRKKELNSILDILQKFSKGDYEFTIPIAEEGINSKINFQLDFLGKMVTVTNTRLQEEKEETKALVTDISHQLKTPLASLKMCFALLSEEELEPKEMDEFLERSKEQIGRLEGLISALVNISRMETGMISIKPEMKDIKETIIQAVNSVYMKAEEKEISINLEQIESVILNHDKKWTKEAIANILDNAIKYSPVKSMITVRMQKLHNYIKIEIEDEGVGLNDKEYTEIFKRFYRGKSHIIKKQEGSGVGLYLTRKILEDQGGNIKAVSKSSMSNENKGCVFIIQLLMD